ncbi:hypothetical protein BpHYR1_027469, partial [Brachionus plicatilis]
NRTSKCWEYFQLKKLKNISENKKDKNGKELSKKVVSCLFMTENGLCNFHIRHNDNSTSKMSRHLSTKHGISHAKSSDENEADPLFCKSLKPNFKIPSRKELSDLSTKYYEEQKTLLNKKLMNYYF